MTKGLYEVLSEKDKELIEAYIVNYANDGHDIDCGLEEVLRFWDEDKKDLYKLLGENLSIHKPVVAEKESEQLEVEVMNKLQARIVPGNRHTFYSNYMDWVSAYFPYIEPINYSKMEVDLKGVFDSQEDYSVIRNLLSVDYLTTNRYHGKTVKMHLPSGHDYTFTNGTKLFKILKKISEEFDIKGFEDYRLMHSQIFNERKIVGELYLTIHPLDYITMSDNANGWSSCMSWEGEGDYRRGAEEMMNSSMVLEAFIPSVTDMKVPGGTWNNKRWRQLFIVNKDCLVAIKGYPYWNRSLEKATLSWIKELAEKNMGWKFQDTLYRYDNRVEKVYDDEDETEYGISFSTNAMYNDLYSQHNMYLSEDFQSGDYYYSGRACCMICGRDERDIYYDGESSLVCEDCFPTCYCTDCGQRILEDEVVWIDDQPFCGYCADHLERCISCDETHTDSYLTEVYVGDKKTGEVYEIAAMLCDDCYSSFSDDDLFEVGKISAWNWYWDSTVRVVDYDALSEDLKIALNIEDIPKEKLQKVGWEYKYNGYVYKYTGEKLVDLDKEKPVFDLANTFLKINFSGMPGNYYVSLGGNPDYHFTTEKKLPEEEICRRMLQVIYPDREIRGICPYNVHYIAATTNDKEENDTLFKWQYENMLLKAQIAN